MKKTLILIALAALTLSCGGNPSSEKKAAESAADESAANAPAAPAKLSAEAVDLGLSVKWAKCNLGAADESQTGNYYAWGETTPKSAYEKAGYKYADEKGYYTKYIPAETLGYAECDDLLVLGAADDAATAALGKSWRMPTRDEVLELVEKCKFEGVNDGWVITGPNGNSIKIPRGGYMSGSTVTQPKGSWFWCSTLNKKEMTVLGEHVVEYLIHYGDQFDPATQTVSLQYRFYGLPIRPVKE